MDSPVAPTGIVACQTQDKDSDAPDRRASTGSSGTRDLRVATAQQLAVPAQDGVGRDEQEEPSQRGSGELVEQGGEERPVGRSELWSVDLALQDSSWWRSARISMFLLALLIASNRSNGTMPVRAR